MANIHVIARGVGCNGGAEVYSTELVRQLANRGHSVTLVCNDASTEFIGFNKLHVLERPQSLSVPFFWRFSGWFETVANISLIGRLGLRPPDLVIGSAQQLLWAYCQRFKEVPVIYLPHSLVAPLEVTTYAGVQGFQCLANMSLYYCLERWALRRAFTTVRFTRAGCLTLEDYYGTGFARRFTVLPAPVCLPPAGQQIASTGPVRLLTVGRLVETKNLMFLIRAMRALVHLPWILDVVGEGEQRTELERLVRAQDLAGRIFFHGHRSDVNAFYNQADLFLFPSRLESLGLVLLEAMSHGVPTLSIRSDGCAYRNSNDELVTPDHDGFLADSECVFVDTLKNLLTDKQRREQAGIHARKTIETKHGWENHVDLFEKTIKRIRIQRDECSST